MSHNFRDAGVNFLRPLNPVSSLPVNDLARRGMLLASIGQLADSEPPLVDTDDLRMALLSERVGEVGAAFWRGHVDLDGELMKVAATALCWLEQLARDRAR